MNVGDWLYVNVAHPNHKPIPSKVVVRRVLDATSFLCAVRGGDDHQFRRTIRDVMGLCQPDDPQFPTREYAANCPQPGGRDAKEV